MPQQCHQASLTPYTQVMSSLRKPDLVRLCSEFKLARDGSVVQLRNHLKHYLNLHRGHLFHNPRYTVLFPRLRGPNQPPPPPSVPTSQAISYQSPSPAFSDETWHGVQDQDGDDISNTPQDQHLYSPAHNSHHDNQDHFDQPLPEFFQEPAHNFLLCRPHFSLTQTWVTHFLLPMLAKVVSNFALNNQNIPLVFACIHM